MVTVPVSVSDLENSQLFADENDTVQPLTLYWCQMREPCESCGSIMLPEPLVCNGIGARWLMTRVHGALWEQRGGQIECQAELRSTVKTKQELNFPVSQHMYFHFPCDAANAKLNFNTTHSLRRQCNLMNASTGVLDELKLELPEDIFPDAGDHSSCTKECARRWRIVDGCMEVDYFGLPSSFPCSLVTEEKQSRYEHTQSFEGNVHLEPTDNQHNKQKSLFFRGQLLDLHKTYCSSENSNSTRAMKPVVVAFMPSCYLQ